MFYNSFTSLTLVLMYDEIYIYVFISLIIQAAYNLIIYK